MSAEQQAYPHLQERVREVAKLPAEERCQYVLKDRWITTSRAKIALSTLEFLMKHPKRDRMPNLVIYGPSGNGKTRIVRHFHKLNQPYLSNDGSIRITPVLFVEMPSAPGRISLHAEILDAVGAPYKKSSRLEQMEQQAIHVLRQIQPKVIVIDEFQHLLAASNSLQQRQVLNQLKSLSNKLRVPLVCVGTEEARSAIRSDPQTDSRFDKLFLPPWEDSDELVQLLLGISRLIPLRKPSDLADPSIVNLLLSKSDGTIGKISNMLERAALAAIESGEERITLQNLISANAVWLEDDAR